LLHPEPLVWVHAARALGRLTGPLQQLEGTLLDWVLGDTKILRQRATTAFASLPADRLSFLSSQLVALVDGRDDEGWVLAAIGAATPYLFFEKRAIWNKLYARVMRGDGGAISARALARGLATLWRRGHREDDVASPLQALRERAREARPTSFEELRRWIEVVAVTDPIDGAERDPLDLELGLENLVRLAAQYDDNEADARAARFASTLHANLKESLRIVVSDGRRRVRAGAVNALEGCARAFALRLWIPLLVTTPGEEPIEEPDLLPTWKAVKEMPATILDLVAERRARGQPRGRRDARGARAPVGRVRARRLRHRRRPRRDGQRHLPLAPQGRRADRRLARAAVGAQVGAELDLLAPRRHDARHGAR
jgi:serine/threonine-protein kinase